jgi:hypothetical protein
MKIRGGLLVLMGALACWSMGSNQARASQVVYDGVGFMQGSQTLTDSFSVASSGTLTVSLANIGWPQPLSSLSLLLTSASGAVLGQESVPGTSVLIPRYSTFRPATSRRNGLAPPKAAASTPVYTGWKFSSSRVRAVRCRCPPPSRSCCQAWAC